MREFRKNQRLHTAEPPLRLGAVRYLNSKPLVEDLPDLAPFAELTLDVPSRLADDLAAGLLDAALVPSVEAFSNPGYQIVSDACVATRGPVLSVKAYFRVPPGDVRTLAADEGSRTSVALTRVLLAEKYGVQPELTAFPLGSGVADTTADAILLIGDRAMRPPAESFTAVWDLGHEWLQWTGLPFVFAMWVAREGVETERLAESLCAARDRGVSRLQEIAAREAGSLGITVREAYDYLSRNLHFQLGSAERSGLKLFRELAGKQGLIPVPALGRCCESAVVEAERELAVAGR